MSKSGIYHNQEEACLGLKAGEPGALEWLIEKYADRLFGYLLSLLRSRELAEDALQEVFLRVVEKKEMVAEAKNLTGYLFAMARNESMSSRRKSAKRELLVEDIEHLVEPVSSCELPERVASSAEVSRALHNLPEEQREVVVLKIYEGMTFDTIASCLGLTLNTAASRYRYAMVKLRKSLGGNLNA